MTKGRNKLTEHIHICVTHDMALWLDQLANARGLRNRSVAARVLFQEARERDSLDEAALREAAALVRSLRAQIGGCG